MAKIRMGVMVGQASGSLGSTVFSRNRYGAYTRLRAKPVAVTSSYAEDQKAILSYASKIWGGLTAEQQQAWRTWAEVNPITDRLGDKQVLDGHTACTRLNANILTAAGTPISIPPIAAAPSGLTSASGEFDIGAGDVAITFAPTPLGAGIKLQVWAAVVDNPGINYVKNRYKLIVTSAANAASPLDIEAALAARFGTLQVDQRVFINLIKVDTATGLLSSPYPLQGTIEST